MTDWKAAVGKRRATARWAYPHDLSDVMAEGQVIGYSDSPMVLIQADDGKQIWWGAELCRLIEPAEDRWRREMQDAINRAFANLERTFATMTLPNWSAHRHMQLTWATEPLRWEGDDS